MKDDILAITRSITVCDDVDTVRAPETRYFNKSRVAACELFRWQSALECFPVGSPPYKMAISLLSDDRFFQLTQSSTMFYRTVEAGGNDKTL